MERETGGKNFSLKKRISEVVYDAEGGVIWNNRAAASEPVTRPHAYFLVFFFFYCFLCIPFSLCIALVLQINVV